MLTLCSFTKKQVLSLINKIEFDEKIKMRFLTALDENLYEKHTSFASNPLLLSIMLLTFDNYAEIPEKLHLFYANAFETLYSKHDATKSGYRRQMQCSLSYDLFKKVFSYFCFVTYSQGKLEFTYDELLSVLNKIKKSVATFNSSDYVQDLVNCLCVLYKDGLNYKFTHRSFQEYFTAIFLKELDDQNMQKMGVALVKQDCFRAQHDSVFTMLRDMAEYRFEQNILLPIVVELESECEDANMFDFYFKKLKFSISYRPTRRPRITGTSDDILDYTLDELHLVMRQDGEPDLVDFIFRMAFYYADRSESYLKVEKVASDKLLTFLTEQGKHMTMEYIEASDCMSDSDLYSLVKATWIGDILQIMAGMKTRLEAKREAEELDLSLLLVD